MISLAIYYKS